MTIPKKNKYGQYFTPYNVADFMVKLSSVQKDAEILEPSCGEGVFIDTLRANKFEKIDAFEIDKTLGRKHTCIKYESFVSAETDKKYDLIIGNPPYIRWKNIEPQLKDELQHNAIWMKYCNSLCDYLYIFILKSIDLLKESGELIFICPEYWISTTHSIALRNYMTDKGFFECIYHFNETQIFDNVNSSIIIFKFIKGSRVKNKNLRVVKYNSRSKLTPEILTDLFNSKTSGCSEYLEIPQFKKNERWLLQTNEIREELKQLETACTSNCNLFSDFNEISSKINTIGQFCDIGNGMVSGLDKAFQYTSNKLNEYEKKELLNVIKAKDIIPYTYSKITNYIFIRAKINENEFKQMYPNFFEHFEKYITDLNSRYNYNKDIKYWEWSFLRNYTLFNKNEEKIFVPCKERISNKNHFRFALVEPNIFPTQDVTAIFKKANTKESIEYIAGYLNHPVVFDWIRCNGIVKGNIVEFSEAPIASTPFRAINWSDKKECVIHDEITSLVKLIKQDPTNAPSFINKLNNLYLNLIYNYE